MVIDSIYTLYSTGRSNQQGNYPHLNNKNKSNYSILITVQYSCNIVKSVIAFMVIHCCPIQINVGAFVLIKTSSVGLVCFTMCVPFSCVRCSYRTSRATDRNILKTSQMFKKNCTGVTKLEISGDRRDWGSIRGKERRRGTNIQ